MSKTLIAYFSCSGVTKKVAELLATIVDGDLYEIVPETPYTQEDLDWNDPNARSTVEMHDMDSRPIIKGKVNNMKSYDTVFIGFPIWWYIAPTIINTFLESYDFSNKTVIPFATSGMSGVGKTDQWLHRSCSSETLWKPAIRFSNRINEKQLSEWVKNLDLKLD